MQHPCLPLICQRIERTPPSGAYVNPDPARYFGWLRYARNEDIQAQPARVEQARQQLNKAMKPYTDDVRQQEHVIAQAKAQLRLRQNPYTDEDLDAAQAAVDQAQAALDLPQLSVKETHIIAPVDGIVFDR